VSDSEMTCKVGRCNTTFLHFLSYSFSYSIVYLHAKMLAQLQTMCLDNTDVLS
jgi:hypothetical protein